LARLGGLRVVVGRHERHLRRLRQVIAFGEKQRSQKLRNRRGGHATVQRRGVRFRAADGHAKWEWHRSELLFAPLALVAAVRLALEPTHLFLVALFTPTS